MGIARSTYYDRLEKTSDDTAIVEAIAAICDEFEHNGWRRVRAALRHKSMIVKHMKIRRFTVTTDSDHNQPIFPNLAQDIIPDGPNQLWVADITYVTVVGGFAYVTVVLDAWSRAGCRIRHQPLDRRAADANGFDRRSRRTQTATGLRASFRSWIPRRIQAVVATPRDWRLQ
ncbi:hypothetical protein A6B35_33225 (plasmid) [Mesorhizobium amorphae CCNWGS0123]|nr:hypothetical protein [Mesorhizobium amorphae]ANT54827.1 hypothetical protein A6B35_33225 [Mesorhizobium amorphae CCNWGS0123]